MASSSRFDVDDALFRLQNNQTMDLTESEIKDMCLKAKEIFLSRPSLLGLQAPISVCGSLHGHYEDLLLLFEKCGPPPSVNYLFLGNYVNIGKQSLRTASLLLAYTIRYPEHVHLLRGDHEVARNDRGFRDECKRLYNVRVWKTFMDCFGSLPFAATVNDKIFCVNGGLSPELASVDQIRDIPRPTDVPDKGLLCDLLFSDPAKDVQGWADNDSGTSVKFGLDVVREFLTRHNFELVCRSRRFVQDGYEFMGKRRELVTIFSAPDFGHRDFDNLGSVMKVDESSSCSFFLMNPAYRVREDSKQIKDRPSLYSNCNAL